MFLLKPHTDAEQIAATTASQAISAGSTANYMLTISPESGLTGAIQISCSGLPFLASCDSPSIQVGLGTATVTVAAGTAASSSSKLTTTGKFMYRGLLAGCLCLLRLSRDRRKLTSRKVATFLVLLSHCS